ncbi:M15 family metallopeptidase [Cellulomonas hominis]
MARQQQLLPTPPHRSARRRRGPRTVGVVLLVLCVGCAVLVGRQLFGDDAAAVGAVVPGPVTGPATGPVQGLADGSATGEGAAPAEGTEATGLDPVLQQRFDDAAAAAAASGVELTMTSGWRSAADQQALVDKAIARYGSAAEARRWVLPPEGSAHVRGLAVDVGPTEGALWLGEHGADFGLCRVYANEVWHFEPVIEPGGSCPELLADSSSGWPG